MRLLIIGGLQGQIGAASKIALSRGAKVSQAADIEKGLIALRNGAGADLIMIDTALDIGELVRSLESERITVPVVAAGVGDDSVTAVRAIKAGAQEYVPLPPDAEMIAAVLEAVTEETEDLVHGDPKTANLISLADRISASDASVLVTGSSGTGKELIARHIHRHSARASAPFVAVNCAAIPETLLETELFGHEKGAFTGAVARRIGKFEEANGGTLLLDEVTEMDPRLQAKLLRVIQEREIDRVGGKKPVKVDVRIIATSNRDMETAIADGQFREDLYFRLNVVSIEVPDLKDRVDDIEPLANYFVDKYVEANGVAPLTLSDGGLQKLLAYSWPGNVRELENVMHRCVLLATDDEIGPEAIQLSSSSIDHGAAANANTASASQTQPNSGGTTGMVGRTVSEVERDLIIDTLEHCLGNRTHAANILGISIRTLRNKLRLYNEEGYTVPAPREAERRAV
jgi:two-component system response regulator FlrC